MQQSRHRSTHKRFPRAHQLRRIEELEMRCLMAREDAYLAAINQTLNIAPEEGVVANDPLSPDSSAVVELITAPTHGQLELDADGAFRYRADAAFLGVDTFTYGLREAGELSPPIPVNLRVVQQPIVINELVSANAHGLQTRVRLDPNKPFAGESIAPDWIELKNLADRDWDLSNYALTDDANTLDKWRFPQGTVLAAGSYMLVFTSGQDIRDTRLDENGDLHTNFKLNSNGEYLALHDALLAPVDTIAPSLPHQRTDVAYGFSGIERRYLVPATPHSSNASAASYRDMLGAVASSVEHGFFDAPFDVTLAADEDRSVIRYTLDGSEPTWENGFDYEGPLHIDQTSVLRAAAFQTDYLRSDVLSRTFVFLQDVVHQASDGVAPVGWPVKLKTQRMDYGMDPDIVNSPEWGPQLYDALTQIPSISLVTDLTNLFDPKTGIYANAFNDGSEWERPASMELLNSDGTPGFQINAGLRIRGGFSRSSANPKHSFRLFFRGEYGDARLEYPLFADEGTTSFQQIDLRTAQNNAWTIGQNKNSFMRDTFSRDSQRDMGQPYKRSRYYHLYLNGQYWGIYETDERAESDFAQTYFGGKASDYDVVKTSDLSAYATSGTLDEWNRLWEMANRGLATNASYFAVQGKNPDGTDNPAIDRQVDVDNLIDYMLLIFYTGNADGPTAPAGINNFYAIRNRNTRDTWRFFAHDSENTFLSLTTDATKDTSFGKLARDFNPRWLHQQLMANAEYRIRFADRAYQRFFGDGEFTPAKVSARFQARINQINQAIIAESARWGDLTKIHYTKQEWLTDIDFLLTTIAPQRTEIVIQQMVDHGIFPALAPPSISPGSSYFTQVTPVQLTASTGLIYYTLDGSDPRAVSGGVQATARSLASGETILVERDGVIHARVLDGETWSALATESYAVGPGSDPSPLRISEVHFHPAEPSSAEIAAGFQDADEFEFIELYNPTAETLNLNGVQLAQQTVKGKTQGVAFDFGAGDVTRLAAGARVVVVENLAAFRARYGDIVEVAGQWSGGLGNQTELLTLQYHGRTLQSFVYSDAWYPQTDGIGASLEKVGSFTTDTTTWNQAEAWRPSFESGGTPGRAPFLPGDVNRDQVFDSTDLLLLFQRGEYEDSIIGNSNFATGDWDHDGEFTSRDLVLAFQYNWFIDGE